MGTSGTSGNLMLIVSAFNRDAPITCKPKNIAIEGSDKIFIYILIIFNYKAFICINT